MKVVAFIISSIMLLGSVSNFSAVAQEPTDLAAYVLEIKKAGMTESAKGNLYGVASIRVGGTILSFPKDEATGQYGRSYRSTACPLPGADPTKVGRWQAELETRIEADLAILRSYADSDKSGFVSSAEGREFRDLIEFGYLAAHVVESEGSKIEAVARAGHLAPETAAARVKMYNELAEQLNKASELKMPILSVP